jgi:hypothetical protein
LNHLSSSLLDASIALHLDFLQGNEKGYLGAGRKIQLEGRKTG